MSPRDKCRTSDLSFLVSMVRLYSSCCWWWRLLLLLHLFSKRRSVYHFNWSWVN